MLGNVNNSLQNFGNFRKGDFRLQDEKRVIERAISSPRLEKSHIWQLERLQKRLVYHLNLNLNLYHLNLNFKPENTVNTTVHCKQLTRLSGAIAEKRPTMVNRKGVTAPRQCKAARFKNHAARNQRTWLGNFGT
ncbi:hypothetical protein K0M31_010070 [Melipona bicolor]|uniref:Uncharacterized protein n=1 Tax=Melipona bicolor TaxID=60889 RepID=A0AA40FMC8_9HYME|nr:hypothetical protein K0M31_010070 [Melipona bicolor]